MPQNTTNWVPTPKQAAVLEAAQEAGLNRSISAICESAGVDRTGFYRWLHKDPQFAAAWEDVWHGTIKRHLPGVVAAVIAKAQDGDIPAARLVADLAGVLMTRMDARFQHDGKVTVDTQGGTQVLERFLHEHPEFADPFIDFLFAAEEQQMLGDA